MNDRSDSLDDDSDCWADADDTQYLAPSSTQTKDDPNSYKGADQTPDDLQLHRAVFDNDSLKVADTLSDKFLRKKLINLKDKHGNTPLHLACMLGRSKEMVESLLRCGAAVDAKNLNRWTPFHEACSYGNRDIILMMTERLKADVYDTLNRNKLSENLAKTRNYRLVLKWEFQSWVPFLTRVLPSDVCVINKQGKFIRIDTRLLDFETLPWKRGESCLIYSPKFEKKWIVLNTRSKKYQHFEPENIDRDIEDKVDEFMSADIMDFDLKSSDIQLTRSTCGWIWKEDKVDRVGRFNAALYNFNNVYLVTKKRREHLTSEDLKRNKLAYKAAVHVLKFGQKPNPQDSEDGPTTEGNNNNDKEDDDSDNRSGAQESTSDEASESTVHRESLPPPKPRNVSWSEYCEAEASNFPYLGREPNCKTVKRAFKASVAMSEEFPITKKEFLELLSIIPLKHFTKLKEFVEGRLPEGFPVRVDVPIFPFLTARITFEDFAFIDGPVDESLFRIPCDYEEDPYLLSRLTGKLKGSKGA